MSASLARVRAALEAAGIAPRIVECPNETRTAAQAAAEAGCALDQIAKSIVFGAADGRLFLFLTAGGKQVCPEKAVAAASQPLGRADAAQVRARTGFAIGGVAPFGHLTPVPGFFDPRLLDFETVWAAAGTPRHIFAIAPGALLGLTGARVCDFTA